MLTLVGYRGTGKSTVAPLLAARLDWGWADADAELTRSAGRTIPEIFEADGEATFRDLEEATLRELLGGGSAVIATGGGAVLRETNRSRMKAAGPVVWLTASEETILGRIDGDSNRPALTDQSPAEEVRKLLRDRHRHYAAVATISVPTDGRRPSDLAEEILDRLPELPFNGPSSGSVSPPNPSPTVPA